MEFLDNLPRFNGLYLYVYNKDGTQNEAITIKNDLESVLKAVLYYGMKGHDMTLTDFFDILIFNTKGPFIDQWEGYSIDFTLEEFQTAYNKMMEQGIDNITEDDFILPNND